MTILLDPDNKKILSISSGGFVDKTLNTVETTDPISQANEEKGEYLEWDDINKKVIPKAV